MCCEDFIHCCPHGQKCNVAAGTCEDSSGSQPWFKKLPVKPISSQNEAVTRGRSKHWIQHTQTQYKTTILFVLELSLSFLVSSVVSDVPCNDTAACPDGSTCCKTKEGEWACCPLPQVNHLIYHFSRIVPYGQSAQPLHFSKTFSLLFALGMLGGLQIFCCCFFCHFAFYYNGTVSRQEAKWEGWNKERFTSRDSISGHLKRCYMHHKVHRKCKNKTDVGCKSHYLF